jgi:hypothetical protein
MTSTRTSEFTAAEREAAWLAHVELSSRIATRPLEPGTGVLREAMTSLHTLVGELRTTLREAWPDYSPTGRTTSAASVVMFVIDQIRGYLTRWHAALLDWEATPHDGVDFLTHEYAWPRNEECRNALAAMQLAITPKNRRLAAIAGGLDLTTPLKHR